MAKKQIFEKRKGVGYRDGVERKNENPVFAHPLPPAP
jgi:hypothetical protein